MPTKRVKGSFKCDKCDRVFGMKAHLARHMSTIHASPAAKAMAAKNKVKKRVGRPAGRVGRPAGQVGRPTGLVTRLGLRDMSLEQLRAVIDAARGEAQTKLDQYRATFA